MRQLLDASISASTGRTYRNAISIYSSFYGSFHKSKVLGLFPIAEEDCAHFIVYLVNRGYKTSSIQTNIAALNYVHNMLGFASIASSFMIKKLILGSRHLHPCHDQRRPVRLHLLHDFVRSIDRLFPLDYETVMYKSMVLLAFHFFLRVGEYTSRNESNDHAIERKNIKFSFKSSRLRGVAITIEHFKHSSQPVTLSLKVGKRPAFCPVMALAKYVGLRASSGGPLYINRDGSPVTSSQFSTVFRQVVLDTNLDPKYYKPHCLRIGGTTRVHQLGFSDSRIREMGRWKSDAYKKYIRISMAT